MSTTSKNPKNKMTRFLLASLILISILCICIFSFLAYYMNKKSSSTISDVGTIYMSSMSEQVSMHFQTTIGLRLDQLSALTETIHPETSDTIEELKSTLAYNANARGFNYLALYSEDGTFEMIYGEQVYATDTQSFENSIKNMEKKVAIGTERIDIKRRRI